jgi:hypothetical protein
MVLSSVSEVSGETSTGISEMLSSGVGIAVSGALSSGVGEVTSEVLTSAVGVAAADCSGCGAAGSMELSIADD